MTKLSAAAASAFLALALGPALASPARADEGNQPAGNVTRPLGSYVGEVVAADVLSMGLLLGGNALERPGFPLAEPMMGLGAGGALLGGPLIHVGHQRYGRAAVSALLRIGLPVLGGYFGAQTADCSQDAFLCGLNEMAQGMVVGSAVAMVIDAAVVTPGWWEISDEPVEPAPARPLASAARTTATSATAGTLASLSPRVAATPEAAFVGVGGRF